MSNYSVVPLQKTDLEYIIEHTSDEMKEYMDRITLHYKLMWDINWSMRDLVNEQHAFALLHDGVPLAAFGFRVLPGTIVPSMIATPEITKHLKSVLRAQRKMLSILKRYYPDKQVVMEIPEKHLNTYRWMQSCGFEITQFTNGPPNNRFILLRCVL